MSEVTQLIQAIGQGDQQATARLLPLVYEELRRIARAHMANERTEHTLQATDLVHEAYLRLLGDSDSRWDGRGHFFTAAAEAMRRILIEHARRKQAKKRSGSGQRVEFDEELLPIVAPCQQIDDLLTLNEAIDRLAEQHPEKAELIKLMYFAGFSMDEAAKAQGFSRTTAYRHWVFAKAWLFDAVGEKLKTP